MPRAPRKPAAQTPIDALRHQDTRANIPTEELREFVADDERAPKTLLYPRDPSLDPQLVWKGKDEQDAADLAVQAVPIYIQEKIDPHALIEDLRRSASGARPAVEQLNLFASVESDLPFNDLVDFYHHEDKWANRMILGDSLLVMASLAEKEGLKGKVQTIYIDPPYGIRFGSNWQVSTRKRDVRDGRVEEMTRQPEQIRAFRDTWQYGIHSYLAYLRDRLVIARELLTDSGSVFVQIGDENVHLVRCLLDEVFGSENFVSQITFKKTGGQSSSELANVSDYLLWYAKKFDSIRFRRLQFFKKPGEDGATQYNWVEVNEGQRRPMTSDEARGMVSIVGSVFQLYPLVSMGPSATDRAFTWQGRNYQPSPNSHWKTTSNGMDRIARADRFIGVGSTLRMVNYLSDYPVTPYTNVWTDTQTSGFAADRHYVVQTLPTVIERCILMTTDPGDLVLDPTCGSGTTAYVAEQWGRRWITIDTSRVALALARTRIMSAKFPYYLLADSEEGRTKEREISGIAADPTTAPMHDVRKGFVYKRVPHITLGSIANNAEIDTIYARHQATLDPLRAELNRRLGTAWEEWEVPRALDEGADAQAAEMLARWWAGRRERQREIDASIARHADTEILYDQPYEDSKRVRVTGPFTVESLSPHRILSTDEERPAAEANGRRDGEASGGGFVPMILDNLRRAGVQNTVREERLKFERLEPYSGEWIQALGEYSAADGRLQRVAISIGPEHGTVGQEWIRGAAREALRGAGFDLLVICGFAFDASANETAKEFAPQPRPPRGDGFVAEETRQYGKLPVMLARMNPDLAMGESLLKATGAGNLFMVFGEPDLAIRNEPDGQITVEVRGVDIYDPTTGEIRSSSTDEIACWFIDSDYDGEAFIVRHAYFTGADEPYDKLKRALRAEIDEAAWAALYRTTSRPFPRPATGKIAVKIINHYGDEVLKVYAC
ncbi:MAG: site-specific DNA-methyltransferase [Chloroflexi bacterium]|nr:MAG: site-specific DNA-methyltransferase [Chloroflexota bacterium]